MNLRIVTRLRASPTFSRPTFLHSRTTPPRCWCRNCPICMATRCLRTERGRRRHRLPPPRANESRFALCEGESHIVASSVCQRNMEVPPSIKLKMTVCRSVLMTSQIPRRKCTRLLQSLEQESQVNGAKTHIFLIILLSVSFFRSSSFLSVLPSLKGYGYTRSHVLQFLFAPLSNTSVHGNNASKSAMARQV